MAAAAVLMPLLHSSICSSRSDGQRSLGSSAATVETRAKTPRRSTVSFTLLMAGSSAECLTRAALLFRWRCEEFPTDCHGNGPDNADRTDPVP